MSAGIIEISSVVMFFIGFYGLITSDNIIKSIIAINIIEVAAVIFMLSIGFASGMNPPIGEVITNPADPLPQAMMFTAVIIGVTVTAVNVTILISLVRKSESTDWDIVKKKNTE